MFTGIIEELGQIRRTAVQGSSGQIAIQARRVLEGTRIGDSIAVNGICLTVVSLQKDGFTADVMAETLRRSSLGRGKPGELVNLNVPCRPWDGSEGIWYPAILMAPG